MLTPKTCDLGLVLDNPSIDMTVLENDCTRVLLGGLVVA